MTVREAAQQWNISQRLIQQYCIEGRIGGAKKFSGAWAIPVGAKKPEDPRKTRKQEVPKPPVPQPVPEHIPSPLIPMPLLNGAFEPGHCMEYVNGIQDARLRDIALTEYYYFSGRAEEAARMAELYISHPDPVLRLSACLCLFQPVKRADPQGALCAGGGTQYPGCRR